MREIKFRYYWSHDTTKEVRFGEAPSRPDMTIRWDLLDIVEFTGLLDKTGKEIFEGDLIRVDMCECVGHDDEGNEIWEDCEGPVSFEDGMFVFDGHSAGTIPLNAYIENVTVIGNIHQMPKP